MSECWWDDYNDCPRTRKEQKDLFDYLLEQAREEILEEENDMKKSYLDKGDGTAGEIAEKGHKQVGSHGGRTSQRDYTIRGRRTQRRAVKEDTRKEILKGGAK